MTTSLKIACGQDVGLIDAPDQIDMSGLSADSRAVKPGFLFAALAGSKINGLTFIDSAIKNGARAVLVEKNAKVDVPDQIMVLRAVEPRAALAKLAARFYGHQPDCVAAVTGTNGKSSVVAFVRQIWQTMGLMAASLGTVGIEYSGGFRKLAHTTPDPVELQAAVSDLAGMGVKHLAIEASSHGLEQHRLDGLKICVGAFTNFSQDHLDYHKTFEAYFAAKMRLFDDLLCENCVSVVNMDSAHAKEVISHVEQAGGRVFSVGEKGNDLKLVEAVALGFGQRLKIKGKEGQYQIYLPLVGDFQVSNALVAAGIVIAAGGSEAVAMKALENLHGAKGRLELVGHSDTGAAIFVDYAHTPDALEVALKALRPFVKGALVVVFGCGGDRDKAKRPLMGKVAAALADKVIVTDDNPRTENAADIRAQALKGCPGALEIGDRGEAIASAIADLHEGDVLLIAGKGHEQGQIVGTKTIAFSDHEAVRAVLESKVA